MFWQEILPEQKLAADRIHGFDGDLVKQRAGAVAHVRLNIHPDGGVGRLRVLAIRPREERHEDHRDQAAHPRGLRALRPGDRAGGRAQFSDQCGKMHPLP
ncbi:hypothetical protein [Shinella granuli]|uniref:hypothetical protein n=1 Tax=Shinella granuli TaxID=323621 RepID=UPI0035EEF93F